MRNPFKRQPHPAGKPSLRDRLAATREKFGRTLRIHRAPNAPAPAAEPAPDRAALVNYATFLSWERSRICAELYPHLGTRAAGFVLGMNAAERFFYPDGIGNHLSRSWRAVPKASTRAVAVLDLVGVDWRSDAPDADLERRIGSDLLDTGERPAVPYGWPAIDAALVTAAGDLLRLDAAIEALLPSDGRGLEDAPGYGGLDTARGTALATLSDTRAESLRGLQAKARAILSLGLVGDPYTAEDLAQSLARDLLRATNRMIEPQPDPVFAAIDEARRLEAEWSRLFAISVRKPETLPEAEATTMAHAAMWVHVRRVLLTTVPATAAGCVALARFACEFTSRQGVPLKYADNDPVLSLIARSPAL